MHEHEHAEPRNFAPERLELRVIEKEPVGLRRDDHALAAKLMPAAVRVLLRIAEQLLLILLAGFVLSQSYFYAAQMFRIGRASDMAGVPMWIPHGVVALGFALILLIACWRLVATVITPREAEHAAPADGKVRE